MTRPLFPSSPSSPSLPTPLLPSTHHLLLHSHTSAYWKLFALICTIFIGFGSHYSSHVLNALKSSIKSNFHINNTQYGILQAIVSFVNTFMPILSGRFIDIFGVTNGSIIFCSFITVGNLIISLSTYYNSFPMILFGRILFGLGGASLITAQHTILAHWFLGSTLGVAIGIQIAISRFASFLATLISIPIKDYTGWYGYSLWVASGLCLLSWFINLLYVLILRQYSVKITTNTIITNVNHNNTNHFDNIDSHTSLISSTMGTDTETETDISLSVNSSSSLPQPQHESSFTTFNNVLSKFPISYWFIIGLSFTLGSTWTVFTHISPEFIMQKYHQPEALAAYNASLGQLIPIFGAPILGYMIDQNGHRPLLLIITSITLVSSLMILSIIPIQLPPWIPLILFSLSLTLGPVTMISSIGLLINPNCIGTALGIYKSVNNIGCTLLDPIVGWLQDKSNGSYHRSLLLLLIVSILAFILCIGLWIIDTYHSKLSILRADIHLRKSYLNCIHNHHHHHYHRQPSFPSISSSPSNLSSSSQSRIQRCLNDESQQCQYNNNNEINQDQQALIRVL